MNIYYIDGKIVQIMLCKILGNFDLENIQVIQLLEVDLNMYLCLL